MKKITNLLLLLTFITANAQAQMDKPIKKEIKINPPAKTIIKGNPAPPQGNPPAAAPSVAYYLTAARVTIVTGNDNKEQPSRASITLATANGGCWPSDATTGGCGMYDFNHSTRIMDEYKVNSVTEISLRTPFQFPAGLPGGAGEGWRYINLLLSNIQTYGLTLSVGYDPNFISDAWKIEKITLTMEFKDLKGNAHPTLGRVTIPFLTARALLNDANKVLYCHADKFFMAIN